MIIVSFAHFGTFWSTEILSRCLCRLAASSVFTLEIHRRVKEESQTWPPASKQLLEKRIPMSYL